MMTLLQRGPKANTQPLWQRVLALFCLGLIVVASTGQVCHTHADAFETSLLAPQIVGTHLVAPVPQGAPDTGVNCPLCVAMHSALPVVQALPQVEMLALATMARQAEGIARTFSWRFEMASRPPPAWSARA